jgi:phosphoenolpyruvate carboxykinase (ATP)
LPLKPEIYGDILKRKIIDSGTRCWLVNTGWTGGPYGIGSRMPIKATRAILETLLSGELDNTEFRKDYNFGFTVPLAIKGVDRSLLNPRENWKNSVEYDKAAVKLVKLFEENFAQHFTRRKQKNKKVFPN